MINDSKAHDVIDFIECLHLTGDFYGQPFKLQEWQRSLIYDVYGTVKENGYRQYKTAYLEAPKKNGKTELIAALAIYHAVCDGYGGQIYCCAAETYQAGLVYRAAMQMIQQDEGLDYTQGGILKILESKNLIRNEETGTFIKVVSADAYSKHGLNPTVIIFDELHAQKKRDLWDTMTFGSGAARKEQLLWVITTAGDDPDHHTVGWEQHEYARKVLSGELNDPQWYVRMYNAPEDADIYDEQVWYDCNPSLGTILDIDDVRGEALKARNSESLEKLFRWLRLNQWVSLKTVGWLPITLWDETVGGWDLPELLGKRCYLGLDLASNIDIASAVCVFPPQEGFEDWRFITDAWIPNDNMKKRVDKDHVSYDKWVKQKYLTATPGDVIDYGYIQSRIEQLDKLYDIQFFCADQWHLEVLRQKFGAEIKERFVEISQTIAGMSTAMGELDRLFRTKTEISHPINPLGRWSLGNVVVSPDGNGNTKPMKNKSIEKIDPTVALVNAMAGAIKLEEKKSVYEERGMRIL